MKNTEKLIRREFNLNDKKGNTKFLAEVYLKDNKIERNFLKNGYENKEKVYDVEENKVYHLKTYNGNEEYRLYKNDKFFIVNKDVVLNLLNSLEEISKIEKIENGVIGEVDFHGYSIYLV
jgi:hypothetical protein